MHNELFNTLETKISQLLDEMELLRMEVAELREAKTSLEDDRTNTQERLQTLLSKLDTTDSE